MVIFADFADTQTRRCNYDIQKTIKKNKKALRAWSLSRTEADHHRHKSQRATLVRASNLSDHKSQRQETSSPALPAFILRRCSDYFSKPAMKNFLMVQYRTPIPFSDRYLRSPLWKSKAHQKNEKQKSIEARRYSP